MNYPRSIGKTLCELPHLAGDSHSSAGGTATAPAGLMQAAHPASAQVHSRHPPLPAELGRCSRCRIPIAERSRAPGPPPHGGHSTNPPPRPRSIPRARGAAAAPAGDAARLIPLRGPLEGAGRAEGGPAGTRRRPLPPGPHPCSSSSQAWLLCRAPTAAPDDALLPLFFRMPLIGPRPVTEESGTEGTSMAAPPSRFRRRRHCPGRARPEPAPPPQPRAPAPPGGRRTDSAPCCRAPPRPPGGALRARGERGHGHSNRWTRGHGHMDRWTHGHDGDTDTDMGTWAQGHSRDTDTGTRTRGCSDTEGHRQRDTRHTDTGTQGHTGTQAQNH